MYQKPRATLNDNAEGRTVILCNMTDMCKRRKEGEEKCTKGNKEEERG